MLNQKEENECNLMTILSTATEPMGSVTLSLILEEQDHGISSATVGRLLSEMDRKGYTHKVGYKGRLLTGSGDVRMQELTSKRTIAAYSTRFIESIDVESKDNLINVLAARRGIEREIARLAAIHASDEDISMICHAYEDRFNEAGELSHDYDINFHRAIARASKNTVLATAYDFIWQNGRLSPVMEFIRESVGSVIAHDHKRILEAIVSRNSAEAEKRMVKHIENLIKDVNTYWNQATEQKNK